MPPRSRSTAAKVLQSLGVLIAWAAFTAFGTFGAFTELPSPAEPGPDIPLTSAG